MSSTWSRRIDPGIRSPYLWTMTSLNRAILSDAELLARLVGFDSTSRYSNLPIAEFICDYLDRPGIRIEKNPSPEGDKTNLVVSLGPPVDPQARDGLVLSGHMDVVPAEEPEWESDPFELRETDEGFYGRGSADMKGFVALAINAAARAEPERLKHPLVLVLTYDEEVGTVGARHFSESWEEPLPRAAVIGEPTSLRAVRMHKGHTSLRLTFEGVSAHSGYPHLGRSAVEPAARAVSALAELRAELESEACPNREHFPEVPFVALNVGTINGGKAVNVVPDQCVVRFGFRVLPGMESAPILERVRRTVAEAVGDAPYSLGIVNESPPLLLEEDSAIYGAVQELIGQDETLSASYATDGGWLKQAGLDCVIFGPGTIEVAHKPNEWMPKDEFARAVGYIDHLLGRFCLDRGRASTSGVTSP